MPYVIQLHTGKIVGERATKQEALDVMREQRIGGARAIFVPNVLGKDKFVMLHTITVKNHSKLLESDVSQMVRALRVQCINDFCPAWGLRTVDIVYSPPKTMPSKGPKFGVLLLVDDEYADPEELGHHTEEQDGTVYAVVNVGAVLKADGVPLIDPKNLKRLTVTSVVSHEILEMIMNPYVNRWVDSKPGEPAWALEVCDPIEVDQYRIVGGTPKYDAMVSNFVLPEFFNPNALATGRFDWMGTLVSAFAVGLGGYAIVRNEPGKEKEVFGAGVGHPWRRSKEIVGGRSVLLLKENYIEPVARLEDFAETNVDDIVGEPEEIEEEPPVIEEEPAIEAVGEVYPAPIVLPCEPGYVPPVVVEEPAPVVEEPKVEETPAVEETPKVEEPPVKDKQLATCDVCAKELSPADPRASFIMGICGQCMIEGKTAVRLAEPVNECPAQLAADDPLCPYDNACPVHSKAHFVVEPEPIAEPVTEPDAASATLPEAPPDSAPITKNDRESIPEVGEPLPEPAPVPVLEEEPAPLPVLEEPASGCSDC